MNDRDPSRGERHKPWHKMTAQEIAHDSIRLTNAGAQSTAFLLPSYFNYDASPTGSFHDTLEVSRVLKISHNAQRAEIAVESMGITDPIEKMHKAARLAIDNQISTTWAINATRSSPRLERLFGHPRSIFASQPILSDNQPFAYTQDYAQPLWEVFAQLDTENNEADLREACRIVDLYIDAQIFLCSKGIFDSTFKLLDNCAMGRHKELYDIDNGFMITDIGELSFYNLPEVLRYIHEKEWRKIATRPEYTPLPPSVQAYFNDAFDTRFTEAAVRSIWSANVAPEPDAIGENANLIDLGIFTEVTQILWLQEAQPQMHLDKQR